MHYFAYKSFKNFLGEDPHIPFSLIYIISLPRNSLVLELPKNDNINIHPPPFFSKLFFYFHFKNLKNGTFTLKWKIWPPHFWFASYGPVSKICKVEYGYEPCNGGSYNTHRSKSCHYIYPKHLDFRKALCLIYL